MARHRTSRGPIIFGTAALLGIGVMALSNSGEISEAIDDAEDWFNNIIDRVSRHEGGYASQNRNADKAGLSFGILQWAQQPGSLGVLLEAMYEADRSKFARIFGPAHRELLKVTKAGSLEPVDGAVLWTEPWTARFTEAGNHPTFQAVQNRLATGGPYFKSALQCAGILGIHTERSIALFLDTAVQQGAGAARKIAKRVAEKEAGRSRTSTQGQLRILTSYAQECAKPFIRYNAPENRHSRYPRLKWAKVGSSVWQVKAGSFDLFKDITRRRMGIVTDPALSDNTIAQAVG